MMIDAPSTESSGVNLVVSRQTLARLTALAALTDSDPTGVVDDLVRERLAAVIPASLRQAGDEGPSAERRAGGEDLYQQARQWEPERMEQEIRARLTVLRPAGGEAWGLAQEILGHKLLDHLAFEIERRADAQAAQALNDLRLIFEALRSDGGAGPGDVPDFRADASKATGPVPAGS